MTRDRKGRSINGWLVIDKPARLTSAKTVAAVKRLTGARKAGHGGTLDPLATGVLPIALGEATKTAGHLLDGTKAYRFTVRWGEERDTDDADGRLVGRSERLPSEASIRRALGAFRGPIRQVPPRYSALKLAGKRAYALAREGEAFELSPRRVEIHRLELIAASGPEARLELECGKGTYVRALVRDLARALGTVGFVAALRRIRVGPFTEESAISLDKLDSLVHINALEDKLFRIEAALVGIPALPLTESQATRLRHGQAVRVSHLGHGRVYATAAGRPVALAEVADGEVRPVRVFNI
ncbi:MAG: tRNA pseudouridine(55) synthase TruB [Proteobacteria bacterium]|nr:tRNA pseudouridine(55) synthase TruB [Pseudomonadota bacterium]